MLHPLVLLDAALSRIQQPKQMVKYEALDRSIAPHIFFVKWSSTESSGDRLKAGLWSLCILPRSGSLSLGRPFKAGTCAQKKFAAATLDLFYKHHIQPSLPATGLITYPFLPALKGRAMFSWPLRGQPGLAFSRPTEKARTTSKGFLHTEDVDSKLLESAAVPAAGAYINDRRPRCGHRTQDS